MGGAMSCPVSCLAYGVPTLVSIGCSVGPSLGSNVPGFQPAGVFMWLNVPYFCHQHLYPQGELQPLSVSLGDSQKPARTSAPGFY